MRLKFVVSQKIKLQDKRSKGLCFCCNDKWSVGLRCRRRELSVLLPDEVDEEDEDRSDDTRSEPPEFSLNSVVGLSNPKMKKLQGLLGES